MGGHSSWRYMGFPVFHAVLAVVVTLISQGESEYPDFLLKLWLLWIPALWFLFHGRTKLWFLPLVTGAPFWIWAAWLTWR
jgi:hypothetical protein